MDHMKIGNWLQVATDGNPDEGYYVVLHSGNSLIAEMASYGTWEDNDGNPHFGWALLPRCEDEDYIEVSVVAYMPNNYDLDSLAELRKALGKP